MLVITLSFYPILLDASLNEHVQALNTFSAQVQESTQELKRILEMSGCTYTDLRTGQGLLAKSKQVFIQKLSIM